MALECFVNHTVRYITVAIALLAARPRRAAQRHAGAGVRAHSKVAQQVPKHRRLLLARDAARSCHRPAVPRPGQTGGCTVLPLLIAAESWRRRRWLFAGDAFVYAELLLECSARVERALVER